MQWKNLGEHTVYENRWFTVKLADVELPDGRHLDHYLIRQRPVVLTAAVDDGAALLLWRHRFITNTWDGSCPRASSTTAKRLKKPSHARPSKRPGGGRVRFTT